LPLDMTVGPLSTCTPLDGTTLYYVDTLTNDGFKSQCPLTPEDAMLCDHYSLL